MNPELLYYAITAIATAASAYGALRHRLTAVERQLVRLTKGQEALHAALQKLEARSVPPGP